MKTEGGTIVPEYTEANLFKILDTGRGRKQTKTAKHYNTFYLLFNKWEKKKNLD